MLFGHSVLFGDFWLKKTPASGPSIVGKEFIANLNPTTKSTCNKNNNCKNNYNTSRVVPMINTGY